MSERAAVDREPLPLRLAALRSSLLELDAGAASAGFELGAQERPLKSTISLCHDCLAHVPALVFARAGRVLMRKRCLEHGLAEALVENDEAYYHLSNKDCWGRRYADDRLMQFAEPAGGCCGSGGCGEFADQFENKSCTILVEVTNACNLACPVCYSDARGDRKMPLEVFKAYMLRLIERKGGLDSVQLTGGEAALHPEFWEMIAFLHQQPVKKIYLPTNGIAFATPATAERCAPFRDKLMVLLQYDGSESGTNRAMRNANTVRVREQVIEHLAQAGVSMQLTMTITGGVNDHEVGSVIGIAMQHSHIKVVALQPVTYSGRYTLAQDPMERMTLSDCVKAVAAQLTRRTATADFKPIPCSHPNCGWITLFVRRFGLTANLTRHIDLERAMDRVSNRTLLNSQELRSVVGTARAGLLEKVSLWAGRNLIRSQDVFAVAIKPFMDRFNYDQDRISNCCHHLLDTRGDPVSFCEYNARIRQDDPWSGFPKLYA